MAFDGTLQKGNQPVSLSGTRLWLQVDSPENVRLAGRAAVSCHVPGLAPRVIIVTPARLADRAEADTPAGGDRRLGLRARPRRPLRPQRAVPGVVAAPARHRARRGSRSSATARPTSSRRCATGSPTTCCASRAASGRRTTTARSSCSPARPESRCTSTRSWPARSRRCRGGSPSASGGRTPISPTASTKQATLPDGRTLGRAGRHGACRRARGRRAASSSRCPGPPRELQELWPRVLETEPLQRLRARAQRARAARAALLRRLRVGRGAGAGGRRR